METRLLLAYAILTVLVLVGATIAFHLWYNARDRSILRQRRVEEVRHRERMAGRAPAEQGAGE